jgi:N-acetylglucosaminyl-diphospho-decaprenol L-rhamnosyltransferase
VSGRPTVDVLIVSYNTRDDLAACLASLERHAPGPVGPQVHVRVFDNASTDRSADMVAASFKRVEVIRSDSNVGFAGANNRLVASSGADYVLLLNPDTVLIEDIVTPLVQALESDPRIALAGPRLVFPDRSPQPSGERFPSLRYELACNFHGTKMDRMLRPFIDLSATIAVTRDLRPDDAQEPRAVEFLWATCWLVRAADARRYGPFDESFTTYDEDLDLCRRLTGTGRSVVYVPSVSLVHVGGASSDPARKRRLMRTARARYYRRHGGLASAVVYRAIVSGADTARWLLGRWRSR